MKRLSWDSQFWNVCISRAEWVPDLARSDFECAWLLLPAGDMDAIREAEELGARVMDIRVEYDRPTGPVVAISRPIKADDCEPLAAIARTAFRGLTRFYADPRFPDARCDDLYEGWFRENIDDPAVDILMVGDGGGPAGFVTVKMDEKEASIVLIACSERSRGRGIGNMLAGAAVNHAHDAGIPAISVVTQGCNIPAQRAFQGAGFRLRSSAVWMHKWSA